jgi:TrmH family RNA methyltransferase
MTNHPPASSPPSGLSLPQVAALKRRKERNATGLILVEGRHPIEEALRAGLTLRAGFVRNSPAESLPQTDVPFPARHVDEKAMARLSDTHSPPPCLAVFERPPNPKRLSGSLALVLDEIQDPGNLGTLIRSAVAFGVESVLLLGEAVDAYGPKVIRASAGLIFALPVAIAARHPLTEFFPVQQEGPWHFYAAVADTLSRVGDIPRVIPYRQADYTGRCAILLGNEGRGLAPELLQAPGLVRITIPMKARVESLNVAVSGAIILAEAAAQRAATSTPERIS